MTGLAIYNVNHRKKIRAEVRAELRAILYQKDKTQALDLVRSFRQKWGESQADLLSYLDKNYFGPDPHDNNDEAARQLCEERQKHWMLCYRQEYSYSSIDTNNYIESWHNTLKRHFLRDKHHRRADAVIYALAVMAVPHFQQKCMRSVVNVGRMNPAKKKEMQFTAVAQQHISSRLSKGYTGDYIAQISETVLRVESFTDVRKAYDIEIGLEPGRAYGFIKCCSCPYFIQHRSCCKHIALVQLEIEYLRLLRPDPQEPVNEPHPDVDGLAIQENDDSVDPMDSLLDRVRSIRWCCDRYAELESIRDRNKPHPQAEHLDEALRRFETDFQQLLKLHESTIPRKPGEDFSNKRARQLY
ncbi:hypothetical protein EC968_009510 [Mortierella alpina]|nr:hypothetical protein EC968_009510 [Mortierella alpina]